MWPSHLRVLGRLAWADALVVLLIGLGARVPLVLAYPAVHGGDSVARVAHSGQVILAYQLPLPQLLVFLARAVDPDPLWTRLIFALVGSLVPVALARAIGATSGAHAGRIAGSLLALHPVFVYYSIVPYQESPLLLLLLLAAIALADGRDSAASLALGLACLCRYEAWIAAPLAIVAHRRRPLRALVLFGWAPILWILAWRGISPAGTYVLDFDAAAGRLSRLSFLWHKLREYSGDALLLIAFMGAVVAWRRRKQDRWGWGAAFVMLTGLSIVLAGHEFPPGSGRVSERLIHLPAAAICALAGLAAARLLDASASTRIALLRTILVAAGLVWMGLRWTRQSRDLVVEANAEPSLQLALRVADFADARLSPGGRLAVAAPPVPQDAIEDYVRKVELAGGDGARARALAGDLGRRPPDGDRIAAQLARAPESVVAAGAQGAELVAVYDDAPASSRWRRGPMLARFTAGERGVTIHMSP